MKVAELIKVRRQAEDPAESWESPYTEREGGFYFRGIYAGHPYIPRTQEDLPAGAWETLGDKCGVKTLRQLLVIPPSVRSTGLGSGKVITPLEILALGSRAVGLWTEKPEPGLRVTISLDELAGVEDVQILLYGRLSFLSSARRVTIRYNLVCRRMMEPTLLELRKKVAGPGLKVPCEPPQSIEIPFKWNFLLSIPFSTLDEDAPRVFRFRAEPSRRRGRPGTGHLLILSPYELVLMRDPVKSLHPYGVDCFLIPRARIQGVSVGEAAAQIEANGARFQFAMPPSLLQALRDWSLTP